MGEEFATAILAGAYLELRSMLYTRIVSGCIDNQSVKMVKPSLWT